MNRIIFDSNAMLVHNSWNIFLCETILSLELNWRNLMQIYCTCDFVILCLKAEYDDNFYEFYSFILRFIFCSLNCSP